MQSIGIKELQVNPANLTRLLAQHEYALITKHSKPIGIALAFDDQILTHGLKTALLIDAYKSSGISLGQLASSLDISKQKTMRMLSLMDIDVVDYDFSDDLKMIQKLR